jgi:hypothetical protein
MSGSTRSLPILDFSRFDGPPSERAAFLADLGAAARGVGFFYLIGHGIDPQLTREVVALAGGSSRCRNAKSWPSRWSTPPIFVATTAPAGS